MFTTNTQVAVTDCVSTFPPAMTMLSLIVSSSYTYSV